MGGDLSVVIRPYEPRDRAAVRHICHVTGYMGEPVDWLWRDTESFADLFTSYYTDAEPRSAWVAELDGHPAGYLLGCVDSRTAWSPARIFGRHVVRRGIALRPGTAGVVWRSFADIARDALHRRLPPAAVYDPRWPAHLHIDLLPAIRGRGAGAPLVRRFLGTLRRAGSRGVTSRRWGRTAVPSPSSRPWASAAMAQRARLRDCARRPGSATPSS